MVDKKPDEKISQIKNVVPERKGDFQEHSLKPSLFLPDTSQEVQPTTVGEIQSPPTNVEQPVQPSASSGATSDQSTEKKD